MNTNCRTGRSRAAFTRLEFLAALAAVVVLGVVLIAMVGAASKRSREDAGVALCQENLRQVGAGLLAYARDNGGALPVSDTLENPHTGLLRALGTRNYVGDLKVFYCPSQVQPSFSEEHLQAGIIGYFYYSATAASTDDKLSRFLRTGVAWPRRLNTHLDGREWVLSDIWYSGDPTAHGSYKKGVNYLMLDGAVGFVAESPRQAFH